MERYLVAHHVKLDFLLNSRAHHPKMHGGALFPAQHFHYNIGRLFHARNQRVVHAHNAVARQDAHFLRRAFVGGLYHNERVLEHVELHAYPLEIATQGFVESLCLRSVRICGVRVELREHSLYRTLREFHGVHRIHIKVGDGILGNPQFAYGIVSLILVLRRKRNRQCGKRKQTYPFHHIVQFIICKSKKIMAYPQRVPRFVAHPHVRDC